MKSLRSLLSGLAACSLCGAGAGRTVTLSGVKYEDAADVRGSQAAAQRRGHALQGRVQGLHGGPVPAPGRRPRPRKCWRMPGAKRMSVTMLRDIDASRARQAVHRAAWRTTWTSAAFSKLIPGADAHEPDLQRPQEAQCRRHLHDRLGARHRHRGHGASGVPQGEPFKEPEFFNALLRIWLGPSPADWKLKDSLLGKPA